MRGGGKSGIAAAVAVALAAPAVAVHEGVVTHTYADINGTATFCAGETGPDITWGMHATMAQCLQRLDKRLYVEWGKLDACIERPITKNQAAALLSWEWNVGATAACRSTLMRKLNAGKPFCPELSKWTFSQGRQLRGLVARRAAERALCEKQD